MITKFELDLCIYLNYKWFPYKTEHKLLCQRLETLELFFAKSRDITPEGKESGQVKNLNLNTLCI
jgi:hypothetical protein